MKNLLEWLFGGKRRGRVRVNGQARDKTLLGEGGPAMPKMDRETLEKVQRALEQYCKVVDAAGLSSRSATTYKLHAEHFVRWLDDRFEPGATLRHRSR